MARTIPERLRRYDLLRRGVLSRDQTVWPDLAKTYGAVGIKLGQHLALRPDIVTDGEVLRRFLEEFTDQIEEKMEFKKVEERLTEIPSTRFAWVDPKPLGAASLAQVHRAELDSGEQVAVKVKREGVEDEIAHGSRAIRRISRLLGASEHGDELIAWLERELDYEREVENLKSFGEMLAFSQAIRVPKVYSELCNENVLTLEFLAGVPLSRVMKWCRSGRDFELRARGIDREQVASNLVESVLEQVFSHRHFHADTHPGNLLALPGNVVGFIDFGLVDVLDPRLGQGMFRYLHAVYYNDVDEMLHGLKNMLSPTKSADWERFRERFLDANRRWRGGEHAADTSPTGQYMATVIHAARTSGYRIPPGILSMLRALKTADFVAYELGSEESLRLTGRNFFAKHSMRELTALLGAENMQSEMLNALDMSREGPKKAYRVLSALADEQLVVKIESAESPSSRHRADARAQLVTLAVMAVSIALVLATMLSIAELRGWVWVPMGGLFMVYGGIVVVWLRLSRQEWSRARSRRKFKEGTHGKEQREKKR